MRRGWLYLLLALVAAGPGLLLAGWAGPIFAARMSGGDYISIPAASMEPALLIGDRALVWPMEGEAPPRGAVILFEHPGRDIRYIKRVIGLPGETVRLVAGVVEIDGVAAGMAPLGDHLAAGGERSRCLERIETPSGRGCRNELWLETLPDGTKVRILNANDNTGFPDTTPGFEVPEGHVFVMGDNRDNSVDSRFDVGFVPVGNIVGVVSRVHYSIGEDGVRWDRFFARVE